MTVYKDKVAWHVLPVDDLKEHEMSRDCWCKPEVRVEPRGLLIIHNSMDGREDFEEGRRKPS